MRAEGVEATRGGQLREWLHTDFAISSAGETVLLTEPDGCEVDRVETGRLGRDISLGRVPDGGPELGYFLHPTPGAPNGADARAGYSEAILFPPPGYYPAGASVVIESPSPTAEVRYTLDGSEPGPDDPLVAGPINIGPAPEVLVVRAPPDQPP